MPKGAIDLELVSKESWSWAESEVSWYSVCGPGVSLNPKCGGTGLSLQHSLGKTGRPGGEGCSFGKKAGGQFAELLCLKRKRKRKKRKGINIQRRKL